MLNISSNNNKSKKTQDINRNQILLPNKKVIGLTKSTESIKFTETSFGMVTKSNLTSELNQTEKKTKRK